MMNDKDFIKEVFQIAFGEGCMECDVPYDKEEVLEKLMEFSDNALKWETGDEWIYIVLQTDYSGTRTIINHGVMWNGTLRK